MGYASAGKGGRGLKGDPGASIASAEIIDGHLWLVRTDGQRLDAGIVNPSEEDVEMAADPVAYYILAKG